MTEIIENIGKNYTLLGKTPSGKNQIRIAIVRGRVMKFPDANFKKWRSEAHRQLSEQRDGRPTILVPCAVAVAYVPGDRIRRDVPGMMDALSHVLEWCPVHGRKKTPGCGQPIIKDDSLLTCWVWQTLPLDRENPRLEIHITEVL